MRFQIKRHHKYYQYKLRTRPYSVQSYRFIHQKPLIRITLFTTIQLKLQTGVSRLCGVQRGAGVRVTDNSFSWSSGPVGGCRMKTSKNNWITQSPTRVSRNSKIIHVANYLWHARSIQQVNFTILIPRPTVRHRKCCYVTALAHLPLLRKLRSIGPWLPRINVMQTGGLGGMGRVIRPPGATESKRRQNWQQIEYLKFKKWVISGFHRVNEIFGLQECYAASLVVTDVSFHLQITEVRTDRQSRNVCSLTSNLPCVTPHASRDLKKFKVRNFQQERPL